MHFMNFDKQLNNRHMNRIITLVTLLVFSGLLLPSCGVTLVKRQHRSGYYVNVNPRKPKADANTTSQTIRHEETAIVVPEEVKQEEAVLPTETAAVPETELAVAPTETAAVEADGAVIATEERNLATAPSDQHRPAMKKSGFGTAFSDKMTQEMPKIKKMDAKVKEMKSKSKAGAAAGGLSLFWIVILILLIFWAFGFWGPWGLGGLVHLLLVVALILLILWLLGII